MTDVLVNELRCKRQAESEKALLGRRECSACWRRVGIRQVASNFAGSSNISRGPGTLVTRSEPLQPCSPHSASDWVPLTLPCAARASPAAHGAPPCASRRGSHGKSSTTGLSMTTRKTCTPGVRRGMGSPGGTSCSASSSQGSLAGVWNQRLLSAGGGRQTQPRVGMEGTFQGLLFG